MMIDKLKKSGGLIVFSALTAAFLFMILFFIHAIDPLVLNANEFFGSIQNFSVFLFTCAVISFIFKEL